MTILIFTFVSTLVIVSAYKFTDSEFNALIDEEFKEISQFEVFRHRRDTDPDIDNIEDPPGPPPETGRTPEVCSRYCKSRNNRHHHRPRECCGKGEFKNAIFARASGDFMIGRNCWTEVNEKMVNSTFDEAELSDIYSCEKVNRIKKRHVCMTECMAKKIELLQEDGYVNMDKVKDSIIEKLTEGWQKKLATDALETCTQLKTDDTWKEDPEEYKCNPHALKMKYCVWKELEMNCPEEYRRSDKHCTRLREILVKKAQN